MICAKSSKDSSTFMIGNTLLSVGKIICMNDHENGAFTTISLHKLARMGNQPPRHNPSPFCVGILSNKNNKGK